MQILKNRLALVALRPQRPLMFDFGDLKLRDLAKLWFFKLNMSKLNFRKSLMTSFQWLYYYQISISNDFKKSVSNQ